MSATDVTQLPTFEDVLRDIGPELRITLETSVWPRNPKRCLMRIAVPGPTPRSKSRNLLPNGIAFVIADEDKGWPDLLRTLADALELAKESDENS